MFGLALSSPRIDRIDPYWYCRLSGLKVAYVTVVFFLINGFLKSPQFPVMSMLVAGACVVLTEMPSVNTRKKKDLLFLVFFALVVVTINVFGLVSYFRLGLLLVVGGWIYVLYALFAKSQQVASIVGTLTLIGLVSIQGQPPTDLYSIVNEDLFFLEYAAAAFVACKLFPNLYDRILLSAVLRILERDIAYLRGSSSRRMFNRSVLNDLTVMKSALGLHGGSFAEFIGSVQSFQLQLSGDVLNDTQGKSALGEALQSLYVAILTRRSCVQSVDDLVPSGTISANLTSALESTLRSWSQLCRPLC